MHPTLVPTADTASETASASTAPPASPGRRASTPIGTLVALLAALLGLLALTGCGGDDDTPAGPEQPTFEYVIPAGSGDLIARGEPLDILPRTLETTVGETIQITNDDTIAHVLGPWFVGPGEVLRQRFVDPGVFEGSCSVHPSGAFTVVVAET